MKSTRERKDFIQEDWGKVLSDCEGNSTRDKKEAQLMQLKRPS